MLIFADENIKSFTMEEQKTTDLTTEELSKAQRTIAVVLAEIQEEGHSKIMPFDIGGVEIRMLRYLHECKTTYSCYQTVKAR